MRLNDVRFVLANPIVDYFELKMFTLMTPWLFAGPQATTPLSGCPVGAGAFGTQYGELLLTPHVPDHGRTPYEEQFS